MAEKSTFFVDMTQFVTDSMGTNLFESAGNLISNIAPVFSTMFGIYLLMVAFSYWHGGGIDEMFVDFAKRMVACCFLVALAFNASYYSELANLIYVLPDELAKAFGSGEYSGGALDKVVDDVNTVTDRLEVQQGNTGLNFGLSVRYLVVIWEIRIAMGLLLAVLFAFYILAKVSLALVLMMGPLFIAFGLFPATRQYAMNWIGQCMNYVFNVVLLSLVGTMMLAFIGRFVDIMGVNDLGSGIAFGSILFFTLIVFVLLCWQTPSLASALTGGATLQGSVRTIYNMARKGLSKAGYGATKAKDKVKDTWNKHRSGGNIKKS